MGGSGTGAPLASFTVLPTNATNTLANMLLKTAECLKGLRYSTSTSAGSTTTLIDANISEPDDFFVGGTIWFLSGILAGSTAVVTDFDSATGTFTFAAKLEAPGVGTYYAVMDSKYSREALLAAVNGALSELGPFPVVTIYPAFVTVADQESYTLPTGIYNIRKVHIATNLTAPYGWTENFGWFEENGSLWFDMDIPRNDDFQIKLFHEIVHATLFADTDGVAEIVHPELLAWTAAYRAILTRMGVAENSEPNTKELLPYAQQRAMVMNKYPIKHFQKASRPSGW